MNHVATFRVFVICRSYPSAINHHQGLQGSTNSPTLNPDFPPLGIHLNFFNHSFVRIEPTFMDRDIDLEAQPRAQQQVLSRPPGGSRVFSSLALPCEFLTVLNKEVGITVVYERGIPPSESETKGDVIGVEAISAVAVAIGAPPATSPSRTPGAGSISPYRRISPHPLI